MDGIAVAFVSTQTQPRYSRVAGGRQRAVRGGFFASMVGDKKGVVVPYAMVQSVGDIVIIKHVSPAAVDEEPLEQEVSA